MVPVCSAMDEVPGVVDWAEAESRAGRWTVLVLAFEAAPAFDSALAAHAPREGLPLAWAASHTNPLPGDLPTDHLNGQLGGLFGDSGGPWRALVPPSVYAARFARLQAEILEGETYQANYTVPFERAWPHADTAF